LEDIQVIYNISVADLIELPQLLYVRAFYAPYVNSRSLPSPPLNLDIPCGELPQNYKKDPSRIFGPDTLDPEDMSVPFLNRFYSEAICEGSVEVNTEQTRMLVDPFFSPCVNESFTFSLSVYETDAIEMIESNQTVLFNRRDYGGTPLVPTMDRSRCWFRGVM